jgi:hypothetical protein
MDDNELSRLVGVPVVEGRAGASRIFNHEWADPATFATIGEISGAEIAKLSGGRLEKPVTVALNKLIFDYDQIIICGPVFPHEVGRLLGRQQVLLSRHRRRRRHQLHALASARSSRTTRSSAVGTRRCAPSSTARHRW